MPFIRPLSMHCSAAWRYHGVLPRSCISLNTLFSKSLTQKSMMAAYSSKHASTATRRLPDGSWDCHIHVVGDPDRYPIQSTAVYSPEHIHSVQDAQKNAAKQGITYSVLTSVSIYGTDNRCLLDALRDMSTDHARGVFDVDPKSADLAELKKWHGIGVRGIRLNVKSVSSKIIPLEEFRDLLQPYLELVEKMDWVLDLHISLAMVDSLKTIMVGSRAKICLDHFAGPMVRAVEKDLDPYSLAGFTALISLLKEKNVSVKLSGMYRLTDASAEDEQSKILSSLARALLREAPEQCVYGSDWPHTRFEDRVNTIAQRDMVLEWCMLEGSDVLVEKVFRTNAEKLWR